MGIIDTLSEGFAAVNKRLWVIAIPVFLDLFLWLGPRLTATGPVQRFFDTYSDLIAGSSTGLIGQDMSSSGQADMAAQLAQMGQQFRDMDFFSFLGWQSPSLIYAHLADRPAALFDMPVWSVNRGIVLLGLIVGMALLSLLFQSAYLSSVAHAVKSGESNSRLLLRRVALNWVRLIVYFALLAGVMILIGLPLSGLVGLVGMLSPMIASLLAGLVLALGLWAALYLSFAFAAMFVENVGPLKGALYSFRIMRRYFWSALGIIVLVLVIRLGMTRIWGLILENPAGVFAAILGNAYIDAGLWAATMIYFLSRYEKWRADTQQRPMASGREA